MCASLNMKLLNLYISLIAATVIHPIQRKDIHAINFKRVKVVLKFTVTIFSVFVSVFVIFLIESNMINADTESVLHFVLP